MRPCCQLSINGGFVHIVDYAASSLLSHVHSINCFLTPFLHFLLLSAEEEGKRDFISVPINHSSRFCEE